MAMNPRVWYPVAAILSAVNVAGVAFAVLPGEPWHATIHAALAVGFGVWAQALRLRRKSRRLEQGVTTGQLEMRDDVDQLRDEMAELQERLDFTERLLQQAREAERRRDPPAPLL